MVNKRLVTNVHVFLHCLRLMLRTLSLMKRKVFIFDWRYVLQRSVCDVRILNRGDNIRCAVCHIGSDHCEKRMAEHLFNRPRVC